MNNPTLLGLAAGLVLAAESVADTLDVPSPLYPTIQSAILAALVGDEVVVGPGTYNEAIFFNGHDITLRSSGGRDVTTIDATGLGNVVRVVLGESPTIDGFTLANGSNGVLSQNTGSNPTVLNCICLGNVNGVYVVGNATGTVRNCRITGNSTYGVWVSGISSSVGLEDCYIADSGTEGIYVHGGGEVFATRCELRRNGVLIGPGSPGDGTFIDCLIAENLGIGVRLAGSGPSGLTLINCTVANNQGAGIDANNWPVTLTNTIIWGNASVSLTASLNSDISYSDIEDGFPGSDFSILADPMFVDPVNGDFRLAPSSPCIDLGSNAAVPLGVTTDLDGNPRFVDDLETPDCPQPGGDCGSPPVVDMGAYEFQACPADVNGDDVVNVLDLIDLLLCFGQPANAPCDTGQDVNMDGSVDVLDLIDLLLAFGTVCP